MRTSIILIAMLALIAGYVGGEARAETLTSCPSESLEQGRATLTNLENLAHINDLHNTPRDVDRWARNGFARK